MLPGGRTRRSASLIAAPVGIGGLGGTYGQFPLASTSDGTPLLIASTLEGIVYGFALH